MKFFLCLILLLTLTACVDGASNEVIKAQIEIALHSNEKAVIFSNNLNSSDKMTEEQARQRIEAIHFWAKEFNCMYPKIEPLRVAKDLFALVDVETRFVNYSFESGLLDGGLSGGFISMQERVAYEISEKEGWSYNREEFIQDPLKQTKYLVYRYYENLKAKGDRYEALLAYNRGLRGTNSDEIRWENYYFSVRGRITYYDELYKKNRSF